MNLSKTEQVIGNIISVFSILLLFMYAIGILKIQNQPPFLIVLGILSIVSIIFLIIFLFKLRKQNKLLEVDYLNIGIQRYILGIFMIIYGVPKLFGAFFDYQLFALDSKLIDVPEFSLTWYFYGKNNWQELVSGILEFVPALFLFHRKTYYVASLVLLFITSQVFVLNAFFNIGVLTLLAATILLACNIYIIYSQKQRIIDFFKSLNFSPSLNFSKAQNSTIKVFKRVALLLTLIVLFITVKRNLYTSNSQKKYNELVGKFSLEKVIKNNKAYLPSNDSNIYKDLYIEKQARWNILRDSKNKTSAFVLDLNKVNDSLKLYINKGGIGDSADILDSTTVLKGTYKLVNNELLIKGLQQKDTLELTYIKQDIKPKKWFW